MVFGKDVQAKTFDNLLNGSFMIATVSTRTGSINGVSPDVFHDELVFTLFFSCPTLYYFPCSVLILWNLQIDMRFLPCYCSSRGCKPQAM